MMTAVMMKADTRPARSGSNAGDSWTIVVSPPTLSWEGVSALVVGLLEEVVVFGWDSAGVSGDPLGRDVLCGVESVGDSDLRVSWEELVLDVELDWAIVVVLEVVVVVVVGVVVVVVVELVVSGFGGSAEAGECVSG